METNCSSKSNSKYTEDDFIKMRLIKKGGFGSVYQVKNRRDLKTYAMKIPLDVSDD